MLTIYNKSRIKIGGPKRWLSSFQKKTNKKQSDRHDLEAVVHALQRENSDLLDALDQVVDLDAFFRF